MQTGYQESPACSEWKLPAAHEAAQQLPVGCPLPAWTARDCLPAAQRTAACDPRPTAVARALQDTMHVFCDMTKESWSSHVPL